MEAGFLVLAIVFLLIAALTWAVFGALHENLARILAFVAGREIDVLPSDAEKRAWHPYYWRVVTWIFVAVALVAALLTWANEPGLTCDHQAPQRMTCALDMRRLGVSELREAPRVLPSIGALRAGAGDERIELLDADTGRVRAVVVGSGKVAKVQRVQLERVLSGERATVVNLPVDVPFAYWLRFPWIVFALLTPYTLASIALVSRSPRRRDRPARDDDAGPVKVAPMNVAPMNVAPEKTPALGCCPRGHGALAKAKGALLEDVCPTCNGRALGADAVQRILVDELGLSLEMLRELAAQFAGARLDCASCATKMSPVTLKGVRSDLCFGCGALWLDDGELARLTAGRYDEIKAV